jgi:hypothetical protein
MFGCFHRSVLAIGLREIENEGVAAMTCDDDEMGGPILDGLLLYRIEGIPILGFDQFPAPYN